MSSSELRITEIFYSLQGEAATVGIPTVFIRLTGCPLRCQYCDSEYAFFGGEKLSVQQVIERVLAFGTQHICVTGGEPLAQLNCHELLFELCNLGKKVSLETSGARDIADVDERVSIVMDLKTPGSGEVDKNRYENIGKLKPNDQLKFVICSREDYDWARFKLSEFEISEKVSDVLLSPSYGEVAPNELANWILEDKLNVRFQFQLHKLLWGDKPGV